jgi:hypothetical protein
MAQKVGSGCSPTFGRAACAAAAFSAALCSLPTPAAQTTTVIDVATPTTFNYTVNGVTQTKPIQRLSFSSPVTLCK